MCFIIPLFLGAFIGGGTPAGGVPPYTCSRSHHVMPCRNVKKLFRLNLDALSVPEALETTIRSLSVRSVDLVRPHFQQAQNRRKLRMPQPRRPERPSCSRDHHSKPLGTIYHPTASTFSTGATLKRYIRDPRDHHPKPGNDLYLAGTSIGGTPW